jgi:RNA polymerase sigma-70 factor (ECF subfamily)
VVTALSADVTDDAIIARVIEGDAAAFELLMRRHNRRVFRATRAIVKNDDEAEDVMQEAYVSAFAHLGEFGGRASFSTWLVRIAVHEALSRLRKGKRLVSGDDVLAAHEPVARTRSPEGAVSDAEVRALLESAVDALPISYRSVFVMRAVEEMSVDETAEALDIPPETVRTRHHRARALLAKELGDKIDRATAAYDFHLSRCDRIAARVRLRLVRGDALTIRPRLASGSP